LGANAKFQVIANCEKISDCGTREVYKEANFGIRGIGSKSKAVRKNGRKARKTGPDHRGHRGH
jgi:hypothetical protein